MADAAFNTDYAESHWVNLLVELLAEKPRPDRTGVGVRSRFGRYLAFDLTEEFPLIELKTVSWKTVWEEMRWMLSGSTNINDLNASIWNEWADENGELGPIYGKQWRNFNGWVSIDIGVDQIGDLIRGLRKDPYSRRHVVSAWNPHELHEMALPPCHVLFQVYCDSDNGLSLQMYQRSCDVFLGLPYNIGGYAFLAHALAELTGRKARGLSICIGDAHLYENHVEQAREVIRRYKGDTPGWKDRISQGKDAWPQVHWEEVDQPRFKPVTEMTIDEFIEYRRPVITGYQPMGKIEAEVAV